MVALVQPSAARSDVTHRIEGMRLVDPPPHGSGHGLSVAGIGVAVAVVFGLLLAVRLVQGGPPASIGSDPTVDSPGPALALAGPGDHLRVARPGDTFWAIAQELAPGQDPRPVVEKLVAANGGLSSIDVGQRLVIPGELLD